MGRGYVLLCVVILCYACLSDKKEGKIKAAYLEQGNVLETLEGRGGCEQKTLQNKTEVVQYEKRIDTNKIYEQADVASAFCTLSESQITNFILENFKHPDSLYVNGVILTDLIIEKDGCVSDVLVVNGVHPYLDGEARRVLKLLPKFKPGECKGMPVRSKFKLPVRYLVVE